MTTVETPMPLPEIRVQEIVVTHPIDKTRTLMWVAHGPDGHDWLLKRLTKEAAERDGLAYFLETREIGPDGHWRIGRSSGRS